MGTKEPVCRCPASPRCRQGAAVPSPVPPRRHLRQYLHHPVLRGDGPAAGRAGQTHRAAPDSLGEGPLHPPRSAPCPGGIPQARPKAGTASRCSHPGTAAPWLSRQEQRRYGLQLVGVLRHVLLGLSVILADYSLFWLLDLVRHQLQGEIVARGERYPGVPALLGLRGGGCPVARD